MSGVRWTASIAKRSNPCLHRLSMRSKAMCLSPKPWYYRSRNTTNRRPKRLKVRPSKAKPGQRSTRQVALRTSLTRKTCRDTSAATMSPLKFYREPLLCLALKQTYSGKNFIGILCYLVMLMANLISPSSSCTGTPKRTACRTSIPSFRKT